MKEMFEKATQEFTKDCGLMKDIYKSHKYIPFDCLTLSIKEKDNYCFIEVFDSTDCIYSIVTDMTRKTEDVLRKMIKYSETEIKDKFSNNKEDTFERYFSDTYVYTMYTTVGNHKIVAEHSYTAPETTEEIFIKHNNKTVISLFCDNTARIASEIFIGGNLK